MIALPAKPTRVALVTGLLLLLLVLLVLAMVIAHAHLGSTPMVNGGGGPGLPHAPMMVSNGGGGPGLP